MGQATQPVLSRIGGTPLHDQRRLPHRTIQTNSRTDRLRSVAAIVTLLRRARLASRRQGLSGGIPARGEQRLRSHIEYKVPDILGTERSYYEARNVLVIGDGLSAASSVVSLAKLIDRVPQTRLTWVTQNVAGDPDEGRPLDHA